MMKKIPKSKVNPIVKKKIVDDSEVNLSSEDEYFDEHEVKPGAPYKSRFNSIYPSSDNEEGSDFDEPDAIKKIPIATSSNNLKRKDPPKESFEQKVAKIRRIAKSNTITDFKSSTKLHRPVDPGLQIEAIQQLKALEDYWNIKNHSDIDMEDLKMLVKSALGIEDGDSITPAEVEARFHNEIITSLITLKAKFYAYGLLRVIQRVDDAGQDDGDGSYDDAQDDAIRESSLKIELRFNKLTGMMTHAFESYYNHVVYLHFANNESDWNINGGTYTFFRYAFPDPQETEKLLNATSRLLVVCLNKSLEMGLRRIGTDAYIPKYYNGFHTNCWIYYKTIREFVWDQLDMELNSILFFQIVNHGAKIVEQVTKILEGIACPQFPPLVVSQYVTAWRNGNYNIYTDKFEYYDKRHRQAIVDRNGEDLEESQDMDIIDPTGRTSMSQEDNESSQEKDSMSESERAKYAKVLEDLEEKFPDYSGMFNAVKRQLSTKEEALVGNVKSNSNYHFAAHSFIDQEFQYVPDVKNPEKIRLKYFDSILDAQGMSKGVKRWLKISLGRMFFPAKSVNGESWEYAPFLIGYSGTGKSTILKFLQYFYRPEEIGLISNNIERQWAMGTLAAAGVLVIIGSEVRSDLKLDQAEFMQCVSNEMMLIMKKNQMARTSSFFTIPIIMAMNTMIKGWQNQTGNLERRILFIEFMRYVKKADIKPNLLEEMKKEASLFIQQVTRMYKKMTETHGKEDLWKIVPDELKETSKRMFQNTSPFSHFLSQPNIVYDDKEYIKYKEFMLEFKKFCEDKNYNFSRIRLTDDLWRPPLEQLGVRIQTSDDTGKWKTDDYVFHGIGIRADIAPTANAVPVTNQQ